MNAIPPISGQSSQTAQPSYSSPASSETDTYTSQLTTQPQFTKVHVLDKAGGKPEVAVSGGNISFGEVKPSDGQVNLTAKDIYFAMNNGTDHKEIKSNPNLPGYLQMGLKVSALV
jgi:hypothetical protein